MNGARGVAVMIGGLTACATLLGLWSCVSYRLSPVDAESAQATADLALSRYARSNDGGTADVYWRAAFCASNHILELNPDVLPPIDAGGLVECHPKPRTAPPNAVPETFCNIEMVCSASGLCWCSWQRDAGK